MHHLFFSIVALLGLFAAPTLAAAQDLVLKRVMLSSGGLGYFEYEATVEGDATLKLTVSLPQVDDVLKSLVVYDDKGGVGGLSLPGREPLAQAFKDLPFDQDSLSSPADLLATLKGAEITVGGGRAITGRIVSVQEETATTERRQGHDQAHAGHLADRSRTAAVHPRGRREPAIRRRRPARQGRPGAAGHPDQSRQGCPHPRARDARAGQAHGAGRLYRRGAGVEGLVPPDPAGRSGGAEGRRLQGWATVENLSGQDWKDIELTLVSGRPVAFHQALYEAYYVKRPEIPVEVAGRLMPGVDRGGVEAAKAAPPPPPAPAGAPQFRPQQERAAGRDGGSAADRSPPPPTRSRRPMPRPRSSSTIRAPVSVANGRTLSIPIIDRQVPAQRLALYQAETAARNPLAAIRLTNDGDTRPAAGHHHALRARQGGLRGLCRRCAPVGLPDRRDAAAGLCARREDHDRARRRADRPHRQRHDRARRACACRGSSARP